MGKKLKQDVWTKATTGCQCYFDKSRNDCACCQPGGCQCGSKFKNQCVRCGYANHCGKVMAKNPFIVDGFTSTQSGCPCPFNKKQKDCACCKKSGCQCGRKQKNQCVQCGRTWQCGAKQDIFGIKEQKLNY